MKRDNYLPEQHRILPHSIEAEKGVIASCLLNPILLIPTTDRCPTGAFFHPAHQIILSGMLELQENGNPIDFIGITQLLKDRSELEKAGGAAYVSELYSYLPTALNHDYYLDIVCEKAWLRKNIEFCTRHAARCYDEQGEIDYLREEAGKGLLELTYTPSRIVRATVAETVRKRWDEIKDGRKEVIAGVSTGFVNLDKLGFRLPKSSLIIIGGPISSGKTSFILNLAKSLCVDRSFAAAIFSKEMPRDQCIDSLTEIISGVNTMAVSEKRVAESQIEVYKNSGAVLAKASDRIELFGKEDCGGMLFPQLMNAARQIKSKMPELRFVFVDYDELFAPKPIPRWSSKEQELTNISAWANELAGELEVTLILLSQMTGDTLRYAKGKAADGHAVATIKEDGQDRIFSIEKNRGGTRDIEAHFSFNGSIKRFYPVEEK